MIITVIELISFRATFQVLKRAQDTMDRLLDQVVMMSGEDPAVHTNHNIPQQEQFRRTHTCRTAVSPQPLVDAYARAGTTWSGMDVIQSWEATRSPAWVADDDRLAQGNHAILCIPSIMVMRGEFDFVTEECFAVWKEVLHGFKVRFRVLQGCSHHGLLENGPMYGEVLDSFFAEFD